MSAATPLAQVPLGGLSKLRDLLSLLGDIRNITDPLTTADGLKRALTLILQLADTLGLDPGWTDRLTAILGDQGVFNVVLAIIQYLTGIAGAERSDNTIHVQLSASDQEVIVDEASFVAWLPLVIQLISLLRQIRGNQ
jgi:hypothetical protein